MPRGTPTLNLLPEFEDTTPPASAQPIWSSDLSKLKAQAEKLLGCLDPYEASVHGNDAVDAAAAPLQKWHVKAVKRENGLETKVSVEEGQRLCEALWAAVKDEKPNEWRLWEDAL